jgi:hypothetical protein
MKTTKALKKQLVVLDEKLAEIRRAIEILDDIESPEIRFVAEIPASWPDQIPVTASDSDPYRACSAAYYLFVEKNKEKEGYKNFGRKIHLFVRREGGKMLVSLSYSDSNGLIQTYCKKNDLPKPSWKILKNEIVGIYYRNRMPNVHYA